MKRKKIQCQCTDPGCPVHEGKETCGKQGTIHVARYDYETNGDHFMFCPACADDACESGVFSIEEQL